MKSNNNSDVNIDNNLSNKIAEAEGEKKNKNHGTNIEDKKESVQLAKEYNNENKEQLSIEKENIKIEIVQKEKQIEVEKNNDPKKEKVNNVNYQEGKNAHEFSFINNNNISQLNNNNNSSGNKSNSLINLLNYSENSLDGSDKKTTKINNNDLQNDNPIDFNNIDDENNPNSSGKLII